MLWPVLRALSIGDLSEDEVAWLRETFHLTEGPRTDGPAADISIAHRTLTDEQDVALVLDLSGRNGGSWVFTLFRATGDNPSSTFVETQRAAFRAAIDHLDLRLVEIEPPATADEVPVDPTWDPQPGSDDYLRFPADLDQLWYYVGLSPHSPRLAKQVKLLDLMQKTVWREATPDLRLQAQEFLDDL